MYLVVYSVWSVGKDACVELKSAALVIQCLGTGSFPWLSRISN